MKIVTFKRPDDTLNFGGKIIGPWNINEQVYNDLVAFAPSMADHFDVKEVKGEEEPPLALEESTETGKPNGARRRGTGSGKESPDKVE